MLKLQYFGHLLWRTDSLEKILMLWRIEGRRRRGWQRTRRLDVVTALMDMSLSKLWVLVKDREAWRAAVLGVTNNRTLLSKWTTTTAPSPKSHVHWPFHLPQDSFSDLSERLSPQWSSSVNSQIKQKLSQLSPNSLLQSVVGIYSK